MTGDQIELNYSGARVAPAATIKDVERVISILREHGQLTARQIAIEMGWPPTENKKRKVRAIARAARPGIVSFANSDGYKLSVDCTFKEINACVSAWDSIIRDATISKKLFLDLLHSRGANAP